ncbi:polymorphic toxin-type HINT domain-containing protein [Streptomyces sp. G-G2]|uniref:polymorphic toxin-type HINT domain-containing protein n=1 Tax=Streptomyces sp. G-G2 TaxID=3046201 RepID=UPI0024B88D9B|nr:polymorphic toxin-type HINT domain-containing protein [Streptomyces sp. G-G2]MDJ0383692.1 polymorphic toxin-type HINT domain-containing protein [Streptomyces sp. G-G2]
MADGSAKAIEEVKDGDVVMATDPQTGETRPETVTATITTPDDKDFTDLTLTDEASPRGPPAKITSTYHHPYWSETRHQWVDAGELTAGEQLRQPDGSLLTVQRTRSYPYAVTTHNLTVNNLHTYYVLAGAAPVLVHNCPTVDELAALGEKPGKNNFTRAGFELQKHANRATNNGRYPFPVGKANPWTWSALGQETLEGILRDPRVAVQQFTNRAGDNIIEFHLPDRGAHFRQAGGSGDWMFHSFREN